MYNTQDKPASEIVPGNYLNLSRTIFRVDKVKVRGQKIDVYGKEIEGPREALEFWNVQRVSVIVQ